MIDYMRYICYQIVTCLILLSFLFVGCHNEARVPSDYVSVNEQPKLYPDYSNVTCPPNIAPLNFSLLNSCKQCVVELVGRHSSLVVEGGADGKIIFDENEWKSLLKKHAGDSLAVNLYVRRSECWQKLRSCQLYVAAEPIDSFLSYRLIEPGYIPYRRLGIYQRNLTNFEVEPVYENNVTDDPQQNHCINCHNFQQYGTSRMLFHVRENHGGTIIYDNGKLTKVDFKGDSIPGGAVYPAWHPVKPWVVFSTNITGQSFHINNSERVEVLDMASDLIFCDWEHGTVNYILHTDSVMENFPHWSPDGKRLYYTAAKIPEMAELDMEGRDVYSTEHYRELRYDVMYMDFDEQNQTFSTPHLLVDCAKNEKSASVPRVSPDGRYVLYTLGNYGQFHIWHKSADLWVRDLKNGTDYPLEAANSHDVESYHTWSSNGRWIAFSSKRDDGDYTRVYIAYFDNEGKPRKALMLPQEDPEENILLLKSYNVPELTREAVHVSRKDFENAVYKQPACKVKFESVYTSKGVYK